MNSSAMLGLATPGSLLYWPACESGGERSQLTRSGAL
ncbi:hypothetical protein Nmel_014978 [Mimus melanotis]